MLREIDEPIELAPHEPLWSSWYGDDAVELSRSLGASVRSLEHFGSTAVSGLSAKPIIDILVAPTVWPLTVHARAVLDKLGYEYLGEAGVPGREYFRRRVPHATNLAVVQWGGALWNDNLALRDYLRANPDVAKRYGEAKQAAWENGARPLLEYSRAKQQLVSELVSQARSWRSGVAPR